METWEEYWTEVVSQYTPAITEDELLGLPNLKLCKTQGIISRGVIEPIQRGYVEESIYDEYGFCGHYDQIYVKQSPISSIFLVLQYPPSICFPQNEREYSTYYSDFIDGTHMKLLVETSNNWILRYGEIVDTYDVPVCTLDNIYIWKQGSICDYPEYKGEEWCKKYIYQNEKSEKKKGEILTQKEIHITHKNGEEVFHNSFLFRITFTICILGFIIGIIKMIAKKKK